MTLKIHVDNAEKHNFRKGDLVDPKASFSSKSLTKIHKKFKNMKKEKV